MNESEAQQLLDDLLDGIPDHPARSASSTPPASELGARAGVVLREGRRSLWQRSRSWARWCRWRSRTTAPSGGATSPTSAAGDPVPAFGWTRGSAWAGRGRGAVGEVRVPERFDGQTRRRRRL